MMTSTTAAPSPEEGQSSSSIKEEERFAQDARFSCNICFEPVSEPVVTRCGHLYCWPCLYRWLVPGMTNEERASLGMSRRLLPLDRSRRVCPVCKSESSVSTVVPIYVDNKHSNNNNGDNKQEPTAEQQLEEEREPIQQTNSSVSDLNSLGLDIDDGPHELGMDLDQEATVIPTTVSTTGLRQRRRDDESSNAVPTRPAPSRDQAATPSRERVPTDISSPGPMVRTSDLGPTPNHHARATLSYGLVLAMHQTLLNATNSVDNTNNNNSNNNNEAETIPSIHYPQQRRDTHSDEVEWDQDPASTVFLSRLLLGLSLFVLFCLLSF